MYFASSDRNFGPQGPSPAATQSGWPPFRASPCDHGPNRNNTFNPTSFATPRNRLRSRRPENVKTPRTSS